MQKARRNQNPWFSRWIYHTLKGDSLGNRFQKVLIAQGSKIKRVSSPLAWGNRPLATGGRDKEAPVVALSLLPIGPINSQSGAGASRERPASPADVNLASCS